MFCYTENSMKKEEKEKKKLSMVLWLSRMGHRSVTPAFGSVRLEFKASWDYLGRPSGSGKQGLRMAHAQGLETLKPQKQKAKGKQEKAQDTSFSQYCFLYSWDLPISSGSIHSFLVYFRGKCWGGLKCGVRPSGGRGQTLQNCHQQEARP